jgi:hypothetical protein
VIAPDDEEVLARRGVPSGRMVMRAGLAHIHALNNPVAQWPATLDDSPAHKFDIGPIL